MSITSFSDQKKKTTMYLRRTPFDGLRLLARRKQCMSSPVSLASIRWNSHLTVGWKSPLTSALELCLFKRRAILPWNRIVARRNLLYEILIKPNTQHASKASAVSWFNDEDVHTWSLQNGLEPLPLPSAQGWKPRGIYLSSNSVTVDFSNKAKISLPR